jgi:hypothetical protein
MGTQKVRLKCRLREPPLITMAHVGETVDVLRMVTIERIFRCAHQRA